MNEREGWTSKQVASYAGVSASAASNWRRRHPEFPEPDDDGLFDARQVRSWLDSRPSVRGSQREWDSDESTIRPLDIGQPEPAAVAGWHGWPRTGNVLRSAMHASSAELASSARGH